MIGEISLNNIRVYSNHGCLAEEKIIGSEYRIDLKILTDITLAAKSDNLKDAVDYVKLQDMVIEEVKQRSALLETVANRLADRILLEITAITKIDLCLSKMNPPINGEADSVSLRIIKERATL
jgi:dihydroneopterin aldolase